MEQRIPGYSQSISEPLREWLERYGTLQKRSVLVRTHWDRFGAQGGRTRGGLAADEELAEILQERVSDRCGQEREEQGERLAADDDDGDGAAFFGAGTGAEPEGEHAGDEGEGGHEDGTEAVAAALDDRVV